MLCWETLHIVILLSMDRALESGWKWKATNGRNSCSICSRANTTQASPRLLPFAIVTGGWVGGCMQNVWLVVLLSISSAMIDRYAYAQTAERHAAETAWEFFELAWRMITFDFSFFFLFNRSILFRRLLQVSPGSTPNASKWEHLNIAEADCLQAGCPSCLLANTVKARKG